MPAITSWCLSSLQRVFPATPPPARKVAPRLELAVNERGSFQVALRQHSETPLALRLAVEAPAELEVRVRLVGYVPMPHHTTNIPREPEELDGIGHIPGYVPDPLFDADAIDLPPDETHAFWVSVTPRQGADAGRHRLTVVVAPKNGPAQRHAVAVDLYPLSLAPRRDFPVYQWFYVDALLDAYRCEAFDARFWSVLPAYFRNVAEHGQDTVYAPVFTPPLDGVKRPSQLLRVRRDPQGHYRFDWRDVKRYVDLARANGLRRFEWTHFFTQWGARHAIRIYEGQGLDERLLWPSATLATSRIYRDFLSAFLPAFHTFLKRERLLACSAFHVSDEPHGDAHLTQYRRARALLSELAPWMSCMDALSDITFARAGLTDFPIASIATALDFVREDIHCGCYYCCGPRGRFVNRFTDIPLAKIRMNGWLFYRWPFAGFLHWGYNYWYRRQSRELIDPFRVLDAEAWPGWTCGDPFVVYPGPDGPIDSIRWEVFGESLQDYALLQTLAVERGAPGLRVLRGMDDFPKSAAWITTTRRRLLRGNP